MKNCWFQAYIFPLLIAFTLPAARTAAQDYDYRSYPENATLHVLAASGLRLRDAPAGKNVVATLPYGARVIARESAPYPPADKIDGIPGSWIKVTFNGKEGYVFDGYLSVLPAPDSTITGLKTYADRYFEKKGKPFIHVIGEEENYDSIAIQQYTYRDMLIEVRENTYFENSEETLVIDPGFRLSRVEIFLLTKALFRAGIERSLQEVKTGQFSVDGKNEAFTPDAGYFNTLPDANTPVRSFEIFGECANGRISCGEWGNTRFIRIITGC